MILMSSRLLKSHDKKIEYLKFFANISGYIISVLFDFHSIQTGHLTENSKPAIV